MKTCRSCKHCLGGITNDNTPVLICTQDDDNPKFALELCGQYEREPGADEVEE